jgi:hypothetical protein
MERLHRAGDRLLGTGVAVHGEAGTQALFRRLRRLQPSGAAKADDGPRRTEEPKVGHSF